MTDATGPTPKVKPYCSVSHACHAHCLPVTQPAHAAPTPGALLTLIGGLAAPACANRVQNDGEPVILTPTWEVMNPSSLSYILPVQTRSSGKHKHPHPELSDQARKKEKVRETLGWLKQDFNSGRSLFKIPGSIKRGQNVMTYFPPLPASDKKVSQHKSPRRSPA